MPKEAPDREPSRIEALLERLAAAAAQLGMDLETVLSQKLDEVEQRCHLLLRPSPRLRDAEIRHYLHEAAGLEPSPELIEAVKEIGRGPRPSDSEVMELEARQNYRCALCGVSLGKIVHPHVDHIVPVARGGRSDISNLQLLCRKCNLGKSDLVGWILDVPYLREGVTDRMRYCVLSRDSRRCRVPECGRTSRTTELRIVPKISEAQGGRLIFDNLETYCVDHANERHRKARQRTGNAAWQARMRLRP